MKRSYAKDFKRIFDLTVEVHERMATVCMPGGYQEVAMRVAEIQRLARDAAPPAENTK